MSSTMFASAVEKLAPSVESQADKWLDAGVNKLRSSVVPALPSSTQPVAAVVADMIASDKGRAALSGLTHKTVTEVALLLSVDAMDEARFVYLRDVATYDEAQDALKAALGASVAAKRQSDEEWQRTKAFLLDLLVYAGKAAIPILLAMI